ncbi:MAG: SIR2 family protein [Gammaproteobacteria bacterium]|nr:SIR2 family protein [Gammaproteobacteria bacterium]
MNGVVKNCDCLLCQNRNDITFPDELLDEIFSGKVSFFIGAGVSTESQSVLNITFYEDVLTRLQEIPEEVSFPRVMQEFCNQPNGRMKLLQLIRKRFDTINSFPELKQSATRFHKELGTLFPVKNIITTNWDTYFEDYCNATPFVSDSDLAFWEVADRRVLKIHGSIENLSTIVATEDDYEACSKRLDTELIGSLLKTILATQTVIFVGYSMDDSDFQEVYGFVREQMNLLHRQAYVVTPFQADADRFNGAGLIPIVTDGAYFIELLKDHAVKQNQLIPDLHFKNVNILLDEVEDEHSLLYERLKNSEYPQVIYAGSYQDGLMHALQRALETRYSGQYSDKCRLISLIESYRDIKSDKLGSKNYSDVAYIEGYINGLFFVLIGSEDWDGDQPPKYFAFGTKDCLHDFDSFFEFIQDKPQAHKASINYAKRLMKRCDNPDDVVFHHPPWL